ncbi:MAG: copper-containing nitrite reductase [Bdellovibrionales bacterium]
MKKKSLITLVAVAIGVFATVALVSCFDRSTGGKWEASSAKVAADDIDLDKLPKETFKLLPPPQVPPPITRKTPARVAIEVEVRETIMKLSDGVDYTFWTFGGTVPGPMLRIRVGDYVDFTLANHPSNKVPHNIDLHAVTGQGGGAEGSFTAPGHKSTFSFRALNPGLYIYHCATAPVGMHVGNGMYGLILVEPEEGLPKVDREYYVVQGEFYTKGKFGERGLQSFDMEKAIREQPEYVVFNGAVGAIAGEQSLKADIGQTVRLFVGNGGPGLISSFHVIGEIFDHVYQEGGIIPNQKNVQTTIVPAGGAATVDFKVDGPGNLILVDHSLFRAFNKGAIGMLKVEGENNPRIYTGKTVDAIYLPEGQAIQPISMDQKKAPAPTNFEERMKAGAIVYKTNCAACHQENGQGIPNAFPPIAKSDYLMADKKRSIKIVKHGLEGAITVNEKTYNSTMPALGLSDDDIASVLTFVRNSFGNKGDAVTVDEVKSVK